MINIVILLTCHNRKVKTLKSLSSLFKALDTYNSEPHNQPVKINAVVYLTDDGCTDGTADEVRKNFSNKNINILQGDGNMFWAGGMRFAWKEALKRKEKWDYYLLLNDDTILYPTCFDELMSTHIFCLNNYKRNGIYSGITCSSTDPEQITYGGDVFINKFTGRRKRLEKAEKPQMCDMTNANILLVPKEVVSKIGILHDGYIHAAADFDYSFLARKKGIPVMITAKACGICDCDHPTECDTQEKIKRMSISERKIYFCNPVRGDKDYITLVRRTTPLKYPMTILFRWMNIYCPSLYYWFNSKR